MASDKSIPIVKQEIVRTLKFIERLYPIPNNSDEYEEYLRFSKTLGNYLSSRMNTVYKAGYEQGKVDVL